MPSAMHQALFSLDISLQQDEDQHWQESCASNALNQVYSTNRGTIHVHIAIETML